MTTHRDPAGLYPARRLIA